MLFIVSKIKGCCSVWPLIQAVYGVLSSTERMDVFEDIMCHTQIGPWYRAVRKAVVANLH